MSAPIARTRGAAKIVKSTKEVDLADKKAFRGVVRKAETITVLTESGTVAHTVKGPFKVQIYQIDRLVAITDYAGTSRKQVTFTIVEKGGLSVGVSPVSLPSVEFPSAYPDDWRVVLRNDSN
jgi:hypothetical protein